MRAAERGFLLLSSHLGDPARRPLTPPQLRKLATRMQIPEWAAEERELNVADLKQIGYTTPEAERILSLLAGEKQLREYLKHGEEYGCRPVTRVGGAYPLLLRKRLGLDSPGCLWVKGDTALLQQPAVSLVGSRDLREENREFAREVGRQAAIQGYVLISGNARGADTLAQESCLRAGGTVICVVADSLLRHGPHDRVLYISEEGYDLPFSPQRALSRNRLIHSMAYCTFVAQCSNGTGGTWDGTCRNLRGDWSTVYCMPDGSAAVVKLYQMGAKLVKTPDLPQLFQEISSEFGYFHNHKVENDKMIK